jgi:hypothetical protein
MGMPEIEVGPIVQAERARRRSYALRRPDAWLRWHADGLLGIRVFLEPADAFDDRERAATLGEVARAASAAARLAELEQTLAAGLGQAVRATAWRPEVEDPIEMRATLVIHRQAPPVASAIRHRPPIAVPVERPARTRAAVGRGSDGRDAGPVRS